jgi:hypothetical protein
MSKSVTLVATLLFVIASLGLGFAAGLTTDQWLVMLQSLGTILALLWVIHTASLQERTNNRDVVLQSLNLIKADLEDLTKSIETEMDKLGSKAEEYERRFHNGERTAYIVPMTARNGFRLRSLYMSEKVQTPQLKRRLMTHTSMFKPVLTMAAGDTQFREIIEASPHGRAYYAIQAALAGSDKEARSFMAILEKHDTGSD